MTEQIEAPLCQASFRNGQAKAPAPQEDNPAAAKARNPAGEGSDTVLVVFGQVGSTNRCQLGLCLLRPSRFVGVYWCNLSIGKGVASLQQPRTQVKKAE